MLKKFSVILIFYIAVFPFEALSAHNSRFHRKKCLKVYPISRPTSLVIDGHSRKILHAENIKERIYPASLTKVMTLYLLFDAIESGKVSFDKKLYISQYAAQAVPLKLGVKAGSYITVREAIPALIVHSANDAAIAIAENLAGSEKKFASLMTIKAKQLGMNDTVFKNASGLHHEDQKTTAIDLAILSLAMKKNHPAFYQLFSQTAFNFRGKTIQGHNRVVKNYKGVEYSKTGFTLASGFNIIAGASRGNKSLIGVVTGCPSVVTREKKITYLLSKHFNEPTIMRKRLKSKVRKTKIVLNFKPKVVSGGY